MPQATPELQWMDGDTPSDKKAAEYLEAAGYRLRPNRFWDKPSPGHVVTTKEQSALDFLIMEWDYGGIWNLV
jgi:hypothetical protein